MALFGDFLQGPLRELAENCSTSSVLRARGRYVRVVGVVQVAGAGAQLLLATS